MNFITIIILAVAVAIDACLIAIAKGMVTKSNIKHSLIMLYYSVGFKQ